MLTVAMETDDADGDDDDRDLECPEVDLACLRLFLRSSGLVRPSVKVAHEP